MKKRIFLSFDFIYLYMTFSHIALMGELNETVNWLLLVLIVRELSSRKLYQVFNVYSAHGGAFGAFCVSLNISFTVHWRTCIHLMRFRMGNTPKMRPFWNYSRTISAPSISRSTHHTKRCSNKCASKPKTKRTKSMKINWWSQCFTNEIHRRPHYTTINNAKIIIFRHWKPSRKFAKSHITRILLRATEW